VLYSSGLGPRSRHDVDLSSLLSNRLRASLVWAGSLLTLLFPVHHSYQELSLTEGEVCRMTELLIEIASWLATFGFIAATIADTFR
jgi:hypothetical protein